MKSDSSTMSVTYKDKIGVIYGYRSSTYYANYIEFSVPCTSTFQTADLDTDKEESKLYNKADLDGTAKIVCDDDALVMSTFPEVTNTEKIANGDTITLDATITGQYENAYSPNAKSIAVVEYNTAVFDDVKLLQNGQEMPTGSVPQIFSTNTTVFATSTSKGYQFPSVMSNEKVEFQIYLDVIDSGYSVANPGNISIKLYDQDYYINSDTGKVEIGVQSNNNSDVGQGEWEGTQNYNFWVITAAS